MNVMYVDDEEILLEVVRNYFEILDLPADCFTIAQEGLDSLKSKEYRLIMVDYNMPGVSVQNFIDSVKAHNADIKIMITSGDVKSNIKLDFGEENNLYFIKKPFTIEELSETIKKIFPDDKFNSL